MADELTPADPSILARTKIKSDADEVKVGAPSFDATPKPAPAEAKPKEPAAPEKPVIVGFTPPSGASGLQGAQQKIAALEAERASAPKVEIKRPERPKTATEDIQIWGALAIAFAALASRRTRMPMTSALNAAAAAIQGMHDGAKERVDQAYKQWEMDLKFASENANFEQRAYDELMNQIDNKEKLVYQDEQMKDTQAWREADLKFKIFSAQMDHPEMYRAWHEGGLNGAADLAKTIRETKEKHDQAMLGVKNQALMWRLKEGAGKALDELKNDPEYLAGDSTKKNLMLMERIRAEKGLAPDYAEAHAAVHQMGEWQKAMAEGDSLEAARLEAIYSGDPKSEAEWVRLDQEKKRGEAGIAGRLDVAKFNATERSKLETMKEANRNILEGLKFDEQKELLNMRDDWRERMFQVQASERERIFRMNAAEREDHFQQEAALKKLLADQRLSAQEQMTLERLGPIQQNLIELKKTPEYADAVLRQDFTKIMSMRYDVIRKSSASAGRSLATMPATNEEVKARGDRILAGQEVFPTEHDVLTTAMGRQIADYVYSNADGFKDKTGLDFNAELSREMPQVRKQLIGKDGDQARYYTVLVHHLQFFEELNKRLRDAHITDYDSQAANAIAVVVANQFGMPDVPSVEFARQVVGMEMLKAVSQGNIGAVDDRQKMDATLALKLTPQQIDTLMVTGRRLAEGQLSGLTAKYRQFIQMGWLKSEDIVPKETMQALAAPGRKFSVTDPSGLNYSTEKDGATPISPETGDSRGVEGASKESPVTLDSRKHADQLPVGTYGVNPTTKEILLKTDKGWEIVK